MEPNEVLGVSSDASAQEVRSAYRTLAQIYHPDRHTNAPASVQAEAERRMLELTDAYNNLRAGIGSTGGVYYETEGWTNRQRAELTKSLLDARIPHEWTGTDLYVERRYESIVDEVLARPSRTKT
jgi:hypothetical protein